MLDGFFDVENRLENLSKQGDPLEVLNRVVPWDIFRETLDQVRIKERKSKAGRKPFDVILMFKILILQSMYNLSDDAVEYQICDRLSFMRFLNLSLGARVPDAKTVWLFREQLGKAQLVQPLFEQFDTYLRVNGFAAQKGQIVDASLVQTPKQRNSREENKQIKSDEEPEGWSAQKARQKDVDARWTKKNSKTYYGYKNHIQVDAKHKFIRDCAVTNAAVHDSQVFEQLLDEYNSSRDVWADSAYQSKASVEKLEDKNFRPKIQRKGKRGKALTPREIKGNTTRSRTRSRVEHIFGAQLVRAGNLLLRSIGLERAKINITLRNLSYNMGRLGTLIRAT
jgi:transposase, IS5 family